MLLGNPVTSEGEKSGFVESARQIVPLHIFHAQATVILQFSVPNIVFSPTNSQFFKTGDIKIQEWTSKHLWHLWQISVASGISVLSFSNRATFHRHIGFSFLCFGIMRHAFQSFSTARKAPHLSACDPSESWNLCQSNLWGYSVSHSAWFQNFGWLFFSCGLHVEFPSSQWLTEGHSHWQWALISRLLIPFMDSNVFITNGRFKNSCLRMKSAVRPEPRAKFKRAGIVTFLHTNATGTILCGICRSSDKTFRVLIFRFQNGVKKMLTDQKNRTFDKHGQIFVICIGQSMHEVKEKKFILKTSFTFGFCSVGSVALAYTEGCGFKVSDAQEHKECQTGKLPNPWRFTSVSPELNKDSAFVIWSASRDHCSQISSSCSCFWRYLCQSKGVEFRVATNAGHARCALSSAMAVNVTGEIKKTTEKEKRKKWSCWEEICLFRYFEITAVQVAVSNDLRKWTLSIWWWQLLRETDRETFKVRRNPECTWARCNWPNTSFHAREKPEVEIS